MRKKCFIICAFAIVAVLFSVYYFYMVYPLKKAWDYNVSILKWEIDPAPNDVIKNRAKSNHPDVQDAVKVDLKIFRYKVFRWGGYAQMAVTTFQKFYDQDDNLLYSTSDGMTWYFEKQDEEWILVRVISASP